MRQRLIRLGILFGLAAVLASCASQPVSTGAGTPGFLIGLFHGFVRTAPLRGVDDPHQIAGERQLFSRFGLVAGHVSVRL